MVGGGLGDKSTEGKELECILEEWMIACGDEGEDDDDDDEKGKKQKKEEKKE